jgi:ribosomal protein S18 acetylase RimI-like enzyme
VTVAIRSAGPDDLATVADLASRTWWAHYPGILTDAQIEYMLERGYSRAALLELLARPHGGIGIAFDPAPGDRAATARAVGFAAWYAPEEPAALKLDKLYVLPQCHGRGVGRALIEHVAAIARAAGCRHVVLNVNRQNASSIRAYERCGFAIRERGDFPIGNGFVMEDYIMWREA